MDSMGREEQQLEIRMLIWLWKEVADIRNLTTLTTKTLTKASPGAILERTGCSPPSKCIFMKFFLSWRICILLLHSCWWEVFMRSLISPEKKSSNFVSMTYTRLKDCPDRATRGVYSVHYDILIPQLAHFDLPDCKWKPSYQIYNSMCLLSAYSKPCAESWGSGQGGVQRKIRNEIILRSL